MKVTIPQELKADVPQTTFGKLLAATPVVMAVVSTMLAGLASSEMTRAQYDRSLAAQQQSKAGDQWSFFQAKRLRGALQRNTADLMQTSVEVHALEPAALLKAAQQVSSVQLTQAAEQSSEATSVQKELVKLLETGPSQTALEAMRKGELPPGGRPIAPPADVQAALDALDQMRPDPEIVALLNKISPKALDDTLAKAKDQALDFDAATRPINSAIDQLDNLLSRGGTLLKSPVQLFTVASRDFTLARLKFAALRYESEARLNQAIANLYELQVRKSNLSAERHHRRSQKFFFGMLGAQAGVIISTFAMAARKRNFLWGLAAAAGVLAVLFAIYVYLYV